MCSAKVSACTEGLMQKVLMHPRLALICSTWSCWSVGVPSPKGVKILKQCLTPSHEELDCEPLVSVRSILAEPGYLASQPDSDRYVVIDGVSP